MILDQTAFTEGFHRGASGEVDGNPYFTLSPSWILFESGWWAGRYVLIELIERYQEKEDVCLREPGQVQWPTVPEAVPSL